MSTIITAIIIVAAIIIIFLLLIVTHKNDLKKKAAKLNIRFNEHAFKNNLGFNETETLHNLMFGLDDLYGKLLIVELSGNDEFRHQIIELDNLMGCSLQKNSRNIYEKGTSGKINEVFVEVVSLLFEFTDRREPIELIFYRHIVDHIFELPHLEQKAVKWQALISKKIKTQLKQFA